MNRIETLDRNVLAFTTALVIFALFLLLYFFPRNHRLTKAQLEIESLQNVRQQVSELLPQVAKSVPITPLPQPDVRTWIAANALAGMENKIVANDGYLKGRGAQVKLKRLSPEQTAQFMSSLTRVRLVIERMQLQDPDGDGSWDMEISLKVP